MHVIKIEKVVFGGKGMSRDLDRITFVPFTLPGETVRVQITKEYADYQEAEAIEIIDPSPDRVAPECPYFGICGGCQISHATYRKQVELKRAILEETLRRNTILFPEIQVITGEAFGYRHRAQLKYDSRNRVLGFYQMNSNRVVDIQECKCLTPGLNLKLKSLRAELCSKPVTGVREVECFENEHQQTAHFYLPRQRHSDSTTSDLAISFRGYQFPMNPNIFLQVNPGLWRAMIQEVESHYPEYSGGHALELYSGAGFFTIALSNRFERITACEENADAVRYAKQHHGLRNVSWICARVEGFRFPSDLQAVIVDPPRQGLPRTVMEQLLNRKPQSITYVSCNCSTFVRDVKRLHQHYAIERILMLDLFPQTFHFETITLLRRCSV